MNVLGVTGVGLLSLADRVARQILSLPQTLGRGSVSPSAPRSSVSSLQRNIERVGQGSGAAALTTVSGNSPVSHVYTRPQVQANVAALLAQVGKIFSENGIDLSREIDLTLDPSGNIAVANDHPDKAQIEQLLQNPTLKTVFRTVAAQAVLFQPQSNSWGQFHIVLSQAGARTFFS